MATRSYTVKSSEGLHARPATILAKIANQYENPIDIIYDDKSINLKSVIGLMSLGIPYNASFKIQVDGENQDTIFKAFEKTLKDNQII